LTPGTVTDVIVGRDGFFGLGLLGLEQRPGLSLFDHRVQPGCQHGLRRCRPRHLQKAPAIHAPFPRNLK
jgi:hypothetical protein